MTRSKYSWSLPLTLNLCFQGSSWKASRSFRAAVIMKTLQKRKTSKLETRNFQNGKPENAKKHRNGKLAKHQKALPDCFQQLACEQRGVVKHWR